MTKALSVLLFLTTVSCASPKWAQADRAKCSSVLLDIADRYQGAPIDTILTIVANLERRMVESEKAAIMAECGVIRLDELDRSIVIVISSSALPCLSRIPYFIGFDVSEPYSPDL